MLLAVAIVFWLAAMLAWHVFGVFGGPAFPVHLTLAVYFSFRAYYAAEP